MSIAKRIQEAIRYLNEEDLEASLLPLNTAIDATAKKEFSQEKTNKGRITRWIRKKQGFITWYLLKGAELTGNIILPTGLSLENYLYTWLRCPITHEAKLNNKISLTEHSVLGYKYNTLLFPRRHWIKIRTTNGLERVNREIKRRTKVAVLFPNAESALRLVTGVLIEIHEDWLTDRNYLKIEETKDVKFEVAI